MAISTTPAEPAVAMTPAMHQTLTDAKQRRRKIDAAAQVATFNAWTSAILAALCVPFALFSISSLLAAMVLGAVAYLEFTGRRMLRELNESGPVVLACNQLGLGVIVILYAGWHLLLAATGKGYYDDVVQKYPELQSMLGDMDGMMRMVEYLTYSLLILGTIAFQGLTALYYWTRLGPLRAFIKDTPPWAIDVLRAAA